MYRNNHLFHLTDYGPNPLAFNIEKATKQNRNFRLALWTGNHFQVTLMALKPGESIGLEFHPNVDQFLRIEEGVGTIMMGREKDRLDYRRNIERSSAIIVPAGTWHNLINTGRGPLKLYSIYAPPQHPHGTVEPRKEDAEH
ncbi:MAG: cupin domain-containing protein [Clostridia bacterium]|nr:cupin domain-containing protein [Clostridia bacterium]